MQFHDKVIAPPKNWETFENLCHDLFRLVLQDPTAQKVGRKGQAQQGVDIFGYRNRNLESSWGIQCKGKDSNYGSGVTEDELLREIAKADTFTPPLKYWIYATTAPVDANIQKTARELTIQRNRIGVFRIDVLGWYEIQSLLADYPNVIRKFYPEHADQIPEIVDAIRMLPSIDSKLDSLIDLVEANIIHSVEPPASGDWVELSFNADRGLGPALLGRPMGPSDATACPRLQEVDSLTSELNIAHSARLVGEPGVGKSICCYQVAREYAESEYRVFRLSDPQSKQVEPPAPSEVKHFLFIDNAHLMTPADLARLEELSSPRQLVLSSHNTVDNSDFGRGSVILNGKQAVHTIASEFRSDLEGTLQYVREVDDHVGKGELDEDLKKRIDHAEVEAERPWHFCFILGGGWRRSQQSADAARSAGSDYVLAAVAIRQLASRDAIAKREDILSICKTEEESETDIQRHLDWLENQRLILHCSDCRTPHLRFASIVLTQILNGQESAGIRQIGRMVNEVLLDPTYSFVGLRNLLIALRQGSTNFNWSKLPQRSTIEAITHRCWRAKGKNRNFAALTLSELLRYVDKDFAVVIDPYVQVLLDWLSSPNDSAYGIARLLHQLNSEANKTAKAIVRSVSPSPIAQAYSRVSVESAYGLADLMRILCILNDEAWKNDMNNQVNHDKLLDFASNPSLSNRPYIFGRFCWSVTHWNNDFALKLADRFVLNAQAAMDRNSVQAFKELRIGYFRSVLRVFDPLNVYVGKNKPNRRQWSITKRVFKGINPEIIAGHISSSSIRDFQSAAGLLYMVYRCVPRLYDQVLSHVDWSRLGKEIRDYWAEPSYEVELLLALMSLTQTSKSVVSNFIASNADLIIEMPPRLVLIAPQVGTQHVRDGKMVRIVRSNRVEWNSGALALKLIGEQEPTLVEHVAKPFVGDIASGIENFHNSIAEEAELLIGVLIKLAHNVWEEILQALDAKITEHSLSNCLRKGVKHRRTAALVIQSALQHCGPIGPVVRRLRKQFPKSSIPRTT